MSSGAEVNWVNEDDERKTALHQSVLGVGLVKTKCAVNKYLCHTCRLEEHLIIINKHMLIKFK